MEQIEAEEVRYFFRDFCKPPRRGQRCHVRPESRERVRIVGTLLRAYDPVKASLWGLRAANDVHVSL